MNKAELVNAVHGAGVGLASRAAAERAVNAVFEAVRKGLKKGGRVQIVGFGTFVARKRPPRTVRNPKTGQPVKIGARWSVTLKAGKALKASL
jgi:DNA-binding protein HU-beta